MHISRTAAEPNFNSSIPVYYFVKDNQGKTLRMMKPENIQKCHKYIISNLTGSAKTKNNSLAEQFKQFDPVYKFSKMIRSVYDRAHSLVYLVTGKKDCDKINNFGKRVGAAKKESKARVNSTKTFEVSEAAKQYTRESLEYLRRPDVKKRNSQGQDMAMCVYFDRQYDMRGAGNGMKFSGIEFLPEEKVMQSFL